MIIAAILFMSAPLKAQLSTQIFSLTPALPTDEELLLYFRENHDPSYTATEESPVSKYLDRHEDADRKISELMEASKSDKMYEQAMDSKTSLGITARQAAGMNPDQLKNMALKGRLSGSGLNASDLATLQAGNVSEADQNAMVNKMMKARSGVSMDEIMQMQGMTDEQRAAYMQSRDPNGEAAKKIAANKAQIAAGNVKATALMKLQNYDKTILDGLRKWDEYSDAAKSKGMEIYENKYRAHVKEIEKGIFQAIQDGALVEIPEPGTEARCAAAAERFSQLNARKLELTYKFYEEYIPIWRNAVVSTMELYRTEVLEASESREAYRQKMYAQTQSLDYVAASLLPEFVANEYFKVSLDIVHYELELPDDSIHLGD